MSKFMEKLISNHTCHFCAKRVNKSEIYSINMDTLDGPHTVKACKNCAEEFDEVLKQIEELKFGKGI